jgi:hypothetical protein
LSGRNGTAVRYEISSRFPRIRGISARLPQALQVSGSGIDTSEG